MKNIIQLLGIGLTACFLAAPAAQAQVKLNADNIDEVISQMTLEEKYTWSSVVACLWAMG